MEIKNLIPRFIKMLIFERHAINLYKDACSRADEAHKTDPEGHRYYVIGTVGGDLKITTADEETRDRKRDKRLLKSSIRKPYVLRKQSFYYTASDVCKDKYQPQGMLDFEKDVHQKMFVEWYFKHH